MYGKTFMFALLCISTAITAGITPVRADITRHQIPVSYTIEQINKESLLIPFDLYLFPSDAYGSEEDTRDIQKWDLVKDNTRDAYIKRLLMYNLSLYMSGTDSPEREFMVQTGWTPKLAALALKNIEDKSFLSNASARVEWSVNEYLDRCDLIKATILCKNGTKRCFAHSNTEPPYDGPCAVIPIPTLQQIIIYQCLIETGFRDDADGYKL